MKIVPRWGSRLALNEIPTKPNQTKPIVRRWGARRSSRASEFTGVNSVCVCRDRGPLFGVGAGADLGLNLDEEKLAMCR